MRGNIGKHVFYVGKGDAARKPISLLQRLRDLGGIAKLQRHRQHKQGQQSQQSPLLLTVHEAAELVSTLINLTVRKM